MKNGTSKYLCTACLSRDPGLALQPIPRQQAIETDSKESVNVVEINYDEEEEENNTSKYAECSKEELT